MKYIVICLFLFSSSVNAGWMDKVKSVSSKDMDDVVINKMESSLKNLHTTLIELNKAGFRADEVWISSSFAITVIFKDMGETGKEQEVLNDNKEHKILSLTLKLLLKTRKFSVAHYKIRNLEVELSIPPKLILQTSIDNL